jgi:tetratricopeptide (TPR) repeat protein
VLLIVRLLAFAFAFFAVTSAAEARRAALVIGQDKYTHLSELANPVLDARRMAALLSKHGFEVISCDGKVPGCFDLGRTGLLQALDKLKASAAGADLAVVFFAGHGLASDEGNILTPVDADVNCDTGAVTDGVTMERIMAATVPAGHKLVILDACRDNPIGKVCPNLASTKLSFQRIEAGAMQNFLLVTSTQFGQQALDGLPGSHSPFATSLFAALEANPAIYFEQVMNEVARATYETAQKDAGFLQIPGKVVGGAAPVDCLAGKACVGDARMVALAIENERLAADASSVRNLLAVEQKARGKPYTAEERQNRVAELDRTIASIGGSSDPLRQEARRLIDAGNVIGGQAKLDEALDADERAIAEAERVAAEKRKAAAQSARDLAVLARGADALKSLAYYERATRLDPADAQTWDAYARIALEAGRTGDAMVAFEQAASRAEEGNAYRRYWATLGLGDVAVAQGNLRRAQQSYEAAARIAIAKADPGNAGWQRDLSISHSRIGNVLRDQGKLPDALEAYRASLAIVEQLAKADPTNVRWQRDLSISHNKIGDVLRVQGNLTGALEAHRASLAIAERLTKTGPRNTVWQRDLSIAHNFVGNVQITQRDFAAALKSYRASNEIINSLATSDPGNAEWQRDLSISHSKIGNVLRAQGDLPGALEAYRADIAIAERLGEADPGNAGWQRDLSVSHDNIGAILRAQGDLTGSLDAYRASLGIREKLAEADPGNASWQRDLALSHGNVATMLALRGSRSEAVRALEAGRAIIMRLRQQSPSNAILPKDLAWFDAQLAALK